MKNKWYWLLQGLGWSFYGAIHYITLYASGRWNKDDALAITVFVAAGFLVSLPLRRVLRELRKKSLRPLKMIPLVVLIVVAFAQVWIGLTSLWSMLAVPENDQPFTIGIYLLMTFNLSVMLGAWSGFYLGIKYWQEYQSQKERMLKADALAHQAQLEVLRYQINPHFLFNALNSVRSLIDEDSRRAREMVTQLSEFLRYSLLNVNLTEIPLRDEIEAIGNYLDIEKIRFEERLQISIDIEPNAAVQPLPGFLIHPLVENAIKYGMQTSPMPLKIAIRATFAQNILTVAVSNSGRWVDPDDSAGASHNGTGIGLNNIRKRLAQIYPNRHRFDIAVANDEVAVTIEIFDL